MPTGLTTDRHVVLLGPMGAGKTSVGTALARLLGRRFIDNDVELAARTGESAADIAGQQGLDALHRAEAAELRDVLGRGPGSVVAGAASVVDLADAREVLGPHLVVWLDAPAAVLDRRIAGSRHRPALPAHGEGSAAALAARRRERFAAVADLRVDATAGTPDDVAAAVVAGLGAVPAAGEGHGPGPADDRSL